MQIAGLSQCFSRQKVVKIGKKKEDLSVISLITTSYETFSKFAYLRPTLPLVIYTGVMRDSL